MGGGRLSTVTGRRRNCSYGLNLKCPPQAHVLKVWSPDSVCVKPLGDGTTGQVAP